MLILKIKKDRIRKRIQDALVIQFSFIIVFMLSYHKLHIGLQILSLCILLFLCLICIWKTASLPTEQKRLLYLYKGITYLDNFIATLCIQIPLQIFIILNFPMFIFGIPLLFVILIMIITFWLGMIMVYVTSVQLGIRWRVIGVLCGWLFPLNLYVLMRIKDTCEREISIELEKEQIIHVNSISDTCKTNYPILLVHGIFFRDVGYLNYWGRIPKHLMRQGATVYYGHQDSARSVENSAQQLAKRIEQITKEYNVEKVNIIAHSKGGLDCRYAISNLNISDKVASLTTINTPHHGCIFANYLLTKAPDRLLKRVTKMYNRMFMKFGDENPDFVRATQDLTDTRCEELNAIMKDQKNVFYHSVTSYTNHATNGRFPFNIVYPIVKHFDGKNDGLVSVESAKLWDNFTIINPPKNRGITHADMIDLNRENIDGFDVREFYTNLVLDLKKRGF